MPRPDDRSVVVIGAGAAGLTAAAALTAAGYDTVCLEARNRVGGRMLTTANPALDLGATWFWDGETRVRDLVTRLGQQIFPQHTAGSAVYQDDTGAYRLPNNPVDAPAYRFAAGAGALAERLAATLPDGVLRLATPVTAIRETPQGLSVETAAESYETAHVVLAVPPALAAAHLDFGGALPEELLRVAAQTPVWMGAITKVVATYRRPFWRDRGLAGAAISHSGPLRELHDMSGPDGATPALFGFAAAATPGFRQAVTRQLTELFGPDAAEPEALHIQDWSTERWTSPPQVHRRTDYGLFGHPLYQRPALDGRLHWASTETSTEYAGHIEGALASGLRAANTIACSSPDPKAEPCTK
ncbi:flavin monoamine oxidase family protein [Amycolatopsis nivea]|uniref:flavin monoamine oxidase family protein n=1 Tax=Amycolatopsis nivea TaxID=1644109 RepID=UPI00106F1C12|nr:FAD-dependent oxidoreductase [Amycolatopsis nivea]